MDDAAPAAIVARLDASQRTIIMSGPITLEEALSLPEGLFDHQPEGEGPVGAARPSWHETELGRRVRELILTQRA